MNSGLLGLARDWLCCFKYPDSTERGENLQEIHGREITDQRLEKGSFLVMGKRCLLLGAKCGLIYAFPKVSQFPLSPM